MSRSTFAACMLATMIVTGIGGITSASAQTMDDLNLQLHGYATQGFLYSTNNNWNTTNSTDGSSAWTEAVLNVTAQPDPKLRIAVQARYFLLGSYGNELTVDFASADYKVNDRIGFRAGKVKTPAGLLNETQDIDPSHLWVLLPQSIYPLASRDSTLSHFGGILYGTVPLGETLGKVEYRVFGGERVVDPRDGYLQQFFDAGFTVPNGLSGPVFGGTLVLQTPIQGLSVGATQTSERPSGSITQGQLQGTLEFAAFHPPYLFGKYERNRMMFAVEYNRTATQSTIQFPGAPGVVAQTDRRNYYLMASYKLTPKLTSGLYYTSMLDHKAPFTSARYQKDWALAARYDFNPYFYAKFEQHFVDGIGVGYTTANNSDGLKPNTRMTLLKLGVSF